MGLADTDAFPLVPRLCLGTHSPEALLRHAQLEAELPESSVPGRARDGVPTCLFVERISDHVSNSSELRVSGCLHGNTVRVVCSRCENGVFNDWVCCQLDFFYHSPELDELVISTCCQDVGGWRKADRVDSAFVCFDAKEFFTSLRVVNRDVAVVAAGGEIAAVA